MIVVDSSALCAVFFNEPEKSAFQAILDGDERCIVSAINMVVGRTYPVDDHPELPERVRRR